MIRLSNSKTEMFMHSERCFWWRYIRKLYASVNNPALGWGRVSHSAFELFFETGGVSDAMRALEASPDIEPLERLEREGSYYTVERLRMVLNAYAKKYADDIDRWDIIDIEANQMVPISDDINWQGIHDLIVKDKADGLIYIIDHKTTGKKVNSSYYSESFDTSQQMTSYHWMGQQLYGDDFGGIIINAVQSTKTIPYNFARFPIMRDDWQIEGFLRNITAIAPRIEECEGLGPAYLKLGWDEEQEDVLSDFPMRWTYSENFCEYRHLNNAMPEMREALADQLYYTRRK